MTLISKQRYDSHMDADSESRDEQQIAAHSLEHRIDSLERTCRALQEDVYKLRFSKGIEETLSKTILSTIKVFGVLLTAVSVVLTIVRVFG